MVVLTTFLVVACGGDGDGGPGAGTPGEGTPALTPGAGEVEALATLLATTQGTQGPALTATPGEVRAPEVAAKEDMARRLQTSVDEIEVVSVEPKEWPDACLGLGEENEVCAQVITPGFEVVLKVGESQFFYRTNQDGTHVRFADVSIEED
ncbi:MAG: hypothetical protein A2148_07160 [Chloroflexi bacterium RBG_16_68_14]|nr:MAG: hypothetical protein A2148_07160 [Chloroflexi bacterium RBG_16_68_14]